ncbi:two-component response regulator-like APRR5-like isoform X1 [Hibiscus syriacus]|uniref:Two-component response regulator-like APRR5-like isoform X1 n=1 Tax=Hibiscus syriacus TaxID=106335 RepID=A0A6A3B0Y0_HIBSY|nr:NDR1/HIN1-like protein 26 [Hibiscus syriacus]KAE8710734.1 two-component response regulator-like APRR5-like isoform X1 [Hibiscus syriacus]
MSQVFSKSPKHCAQKGLTIDKSYKKLFLVFSAFSTIFLAFVFIIWLILHPAKLQFSLREADIYQLNLSSPHLLNSFIQLTLLLRNPNKKDGLYYDELQAYAAYKGQQITGDTSLPPFYQGHGESNLLTTSLQGTGLPVAPSFGYEVGRDQTIGRMVLTLKINGKLRWKVGTWVSGRYRFNVNCVSVMAFGPNAPTVPLCSNQASVPPLCEKMLTNMCLEVIQSIFISFMFLK